MTQLAMQAVQQALVSKLQGDALLMDAVSAVYDTVPPQASLPYVEIDLVEQESLPALGEQLWRVAVVLNVWTQAGGRKHALAALERLHGLLHHGSLSPSGYSLREMRVVSASCELGRDGAQVVGNMEVGLTVAAS